MPHRSDNPRPLRVVVRQGPPRGRGSAPDVHLSVAWPRAGGGSLAAVAAHAGGLREGSVACVLVSPEDGVRLAALAPAGLHLRLWCAVRLSPGAAPAAPGHLPCAHAALLVYARSAGPLRHTTTRLSYTYCPACGRSTKDYGGKKHTYHEYGTLLADVWRDIEVDPSGDLSPLCDRLRDLFGLAPHRALHVWRVASRAPRRASPAGAQPESAAAPRRGPRVELLNADCLGALRRLPADSIDWCFADPPYNVAKVYDTWDDAQRPGEYDVWCDAWLDELARVIRPGCSVTVVNIPRLAARHAARLARTLRFQNWIAWDGLGVPVRRIMPAHYGIVSFSKGPPRPLPGLAAPAPPEAALLQPAPEWFCLRRSCLWAHAAERRRAAAPLTDLWHDIHRLKHNSRRTDHPCQLPPALMRRLIALFTAPGETILDPFNGAGTTTLCALQLGRSAMGVECSPAYHAIAESRHAALAAGVDPFAPRDATPRAKNSRVERLPRRRYEVPKKTLQLEVRRIARDLGRLPTRDEVAAMSAHPIRYFDEYFVSWGEACASARHAGMSERPARQAAAAAL